MLTGQTLLEFGIIVHPSLTRINHQNLTRLETSLLTDLCRINGKHSGFARYHHRIITGNQIAGRTESVTVKHTSGITSVTEKNGGRSVPRFHQNGMIFIESLQRITDRILAIERFRHEHRHGMRKAQSGMKEKLKRIVK